MSEESILSTKANKRQTLCSTLLSWQEVVVFLEYKTLLQCWSDEWIWVKIRGVNNFNLFITCFIKSKLACHAVGSFNA